MRIRDAQGMRRTFQEGNITAQSKFMRWGHDTWASLDHPPAPDSLNFASGVSPTSRSIRGRIGIGL